MATSQGGTKRKKRDKSDKVPVCEGQTEEERRVLRQEQRTLQDHISERQGDLCALDNSAFADHRDEANDLFKKVRFNREMVNDGDIMVGLAECAMKRAGALAKSVKQYGAADIVKALGSEFGKTGEMDWAELGRAGAGLFRAPPELRFLCGPLEKPQKERKKAERRKKADQGPAEATQFDTRQGDDQDGDAVDEATNLRLQRLNDVMAARMRRGGLEPATADETSGPGLDLMSLLVNPDSFCETAENFFDLSFLVKDAKASVHIDDETGLPTCRLAEQPEEAVPKTQNVVVLSMRDCQEIGRLWGIDKTPLERDGGAARPPPPPPDDE